MFILFSNQSVPDYLIRRWEERDTGGSHGELKLLGLSQGFWGCNFGRGKGRASEGVFLQGESRYTMVPLSPFSGLLLCMQKGEGRKRVAVKCS